MIHTYVADIERNVNIIIYYHEKSSPGKIAMFINHRHPSLVRDPYYGAQNRAEAHDGYSC